MAEETLPERVEPALSAWILATEPGHEVASLRLDPALLRKEKRVVLSDLFAQAASQTPPADPLASLEPADQALYQRLQALAQKGRQGQKADALLQMRAMAEMFANSPLAPEILLQAALLEEETSEQRIQGLYGVIQRDSKTLAARKSLLALGETFTLLQEFPYALDAYKAYALAQGPGASDPLFRLRVVDGLMRLQNYREALDQLNGTDWSKAARRVVQKALDLKGECLAALGRSNEAIPLLCAFRDTYPDYALAAKIELTLGFCYEEQRQTDEAQAVYARIAQVYAAETFEVRTARARLTALQTSLFAPAPAAPETSVPNPASGELKRATSQKRRVREEDIRAQNALEGPGVSGRPPVSTPEMLYAPPVLNVPAPPSGPQGENLLEQNPTH
jgi:hypothetical protein